MLKRSTKFWYWAKTTKEVEPARYIIWLDRRNQPQKKKDFMYLMTDWPSNQPTPCSTVLLQNLTDPQLFNKFRAFYESQTLIPAVTAAHHLPCAQPHQYGAHPPTLCSATPIWCTSSHLVLSHTNMVQHILPLYFFKIQFNNIFPTMPRSST